MSYPLTDQFPFELYEGGLNRQQTSVTDVVIQENTKQTETTEYTEDDANTLPPKCKKT